MGRNHSNTAESEGFKPPIPVMGIPDFESSAFGHSANFPKKYGWKLFLLLKSELSPSFERSVNHLFENSVTLV